MASLNSMWRPTTLHSPVTSASSRSYTHSQCTLTSLFTGPAVVHRACSKAVKHALSLMDICQDTMAEPLQRFPIGECETLRQRIKKLFHSWGGLQPELSV